MTDQELVSRALSAMRHAYAPYSRFPVGAALLTADGRVYTGCNIEGASYGTTICAERTALVKAVSEGERRFAALAVCAQTDDLCTPCGVCRQMLYEFAPDLRVLCADQNGRFEEHALAALLPHAFSADSL